MIAAHLMQRHVVVAGAFVRCDRLQVRPDFGSHWDLVEIHRASPSPPPARSDAAAAARPGAPLGSPATATSIERFPPRRRDRRRSTTSTHRSSACPRLRGRRTCRGSPTLVRCRTCHRHAQQPPLRLPCRTQRGRSRQLSREAVQSCPINGEGRPVMGDQVTLEQLADDRHCLEQHLATLFGARPTPAEDVFVEVLPRTETEDESTIEQCRCRGSSLCHQRRVHPADRTGHGGRYPKPVGPRSDGAQDGPDERGFALRVHPGMEVIRDRRELEPCSLGSYRIEHQLLGRAFLTTQFVAQRDGHASSAPP